MAEDVRITAVAPRRFPRLRRRIPLGLCAVLGLALLIRGGVLVATPGALTGNVDNYRQLAENLLANGTFGTDHTPTAYRPPLYPLLLVGCVALGDAARIAIGVLHVVLGLATVALVWVLGATAGLSGSTGSTVGQANLGAPANRTFSLPCNALPLQWGGFCRRHKRVENRTRQPRPLLGCPIRRDGPHPPDPVGLGHDRNPGCLLDYGRIGRAHLGRPPADNPSGHVGRGHAGPRRALPAHAAALDGAGRRGAFVANQVSLTRDTLGVPARCTDRVESLGDSQPASASAGRSLPRHTAAIRSSWGIIPSSTSGSARARGEACGGPIA